MGLVSIIGSLCCLEVKMGVAGQPTVYKSFSAVLLRVQSLRCVVRAKTVAKPAMHSQQQRFSVYLLQLLLT